MEHVRLGLLTLLFAACGGASTRPLPSTSNASLGETTFRRHCERCHAGGEAGYGGPALSESTRSPAQARALIRNGGSAGTYVTMPAFPPDAIRESELDALMHYLERFGISE